MDNVLTDIRSIRNRINIKSDKIYKYVLPTQFKASKSVANQAIYANRQWFSFHSLIVDHIYNLVNETNVKELSTNDKLTLLNIAVKKKDLKVIGIILSYIRNWELSDFSEIEYMIYNTFSNRELNIIENTVPKWDFTDRLPVINYENKFDYCNTIKLIKQIIIKPEYMKIKKKSVDEFLELIKSSFEVKVTKYKGEGKGENEDEDEDKGENEDEDEDKGENEDEDKNKKNKKEKDNKNKKEKDNKNKKEKDNKNKKEKDNKNKKEKDNKNKKEKDNKNKKEKDNKNKKEKDNKNKKEKDSKNKKDNKKEKNNKTENNIETRSNIIPPSYIDPTVIEIYIKKQFNVNYKRKLEENKKNKKDEVNIVNPLKQLGSQVIQQIIKKVDKMYQSFFALKKNPPKHMNKNKISPPHYLKNERFVLIFQKNSFHIDTNFDKNNNLIKYAKLSPGLMMKKEVKEEHPGSDGYLKFKIPNYIKEDIEEIEITPGKNVNDAYVIFKYNKIIPQPALIMESIRDNMTENKGDGKKKNKKKIKRNYISKQDTTKMSESDLENMAKKIMAIDLGIVNIATCVCLGLDAPMIYTGAMINYINKYYKKLISKKQSKIKTESNTYKSKYMNNLWTRRECKIRNQFERITNDIMKICNEKGITEIIIGYNTNWKHNVNMGSNMNDKFYKIPYKQFIDMLYYKGNNKGINVSETTESYTSKCDALNLETIEYHEKYSGERGPKIIKSKKKEIHLTKGSRGLFQSAKRVLLKSDVNGAINIMRKGVKKRPKLEAILEKIISKIEKKKICNPISKKFPN
jgi:IS605 OrfB family transposase